VLHGLSGCTFLKETIGLGPTKPKVQVVDVAVTKASLVALELTVRLRVDNPNGFDLDFSKLRYRMVAGELEIAKGTYDKKIKVPEHGRVDVDLPLTVDTNNALKLIKDVVQGHHDVVAETTATADFDTPLGAMAVDVVDKRPLKKLAGF
jgi:LEA14-like dessication related protein